MNNFGGSLSTIASAGSAALSSSGSVNHINDLDALAPHIQFHFQIGIFREPVTISLTGLSLQLLKEYACAVLEKQVR